MEGGWGKFRLLITLKAGNRDALKSNPKEKHISKLPQNPVKKLGLLRQKDGDDILFNRLEPKRPKVCLFPLFNQKLESRVFWKSLRDHDRKSQNGFKRKKAKSGFGSYPIHVVDQFSFPGKHFPREIKRFS